MKCKKCGFALEEGQTFCNMCGAEQSKIKEKPKSRVKSLLGIVKFTSKNHRRTWLNFVLGLGLLVFLIFFDDYKKGMGVDIPAISLTILALVYVIVQLVMGYKNPESTHTKRYKYGIRLTWLVYILLILWVIFINDNPQKIVEGFKNLVNFNIPWQP